jgi:hypothetical protein
MAGGWIGGSSLHRDDVIDLRRVRLAKSPYILSICLRMQSFLGGEATLS